MTGDLKDIASKIDFENDKKTRLELYQKYSQKFDKYNRIK